MRGERAREQQRPGAQAEPGDGRGHGSGRDVRPRPCRSWARAESSSCNTYASTSATVTTSSHQAASRKWNAWPAGPKLTPSAPADASAPASSSGRNGRSPQAAARPSAEADVEERAVHVSRAQSVRYLRGRAVDGRRRYDERRHAGRMSARRWRMAPRRMAAQGGWTRPCQGCGQTDDAPGRQRTSWRATRRCSRRARAG